MLNFRKTDKTEGKHRKKSVLEERMETEDMIAALFNSRLLLSGLVIFNFFFEQLIQNLRNYHMLYLRFYFYCLLLTGCQI